MDRLALTNATPRIVVSGMATVDNLYWLGQHPKENSENAVTDYLPVVGGPAGRGAITCARLGATTYLVATCGTGVFGVALRDLLANEPLLVDLTEHPVPSQHSCIILSAETGARTTIWVGSPQAGEASAETLTLLTRQADAVLVDVTDSTLTRSAITAATSVNIPVVLDTGDYLDWEIDLLHGVTHLVCSEGFARRATASAPRSTWARLLRDQYGIATVAVTEGSRGGWWFDQDGEHRWGAVEALPVDSCGAGDTFHGAFTWAIASGLGISDAFDVAAWAAARKVAGRGNSTIPTGTELRTAMKIEVTPRRQPDGH